MLVKQPISINFGQGVNTKPDPKQVPVGQFLSLQNSIFDEIGLLKKRNGFGELTALPNPASYLTTFNGDLTALGSTLQAYSTGTSQWITKGSIQPVSLNTLPLVRNSVEQTQCDSSVASNGVICTVYTEYNGSSTSYKYVLADSSTGQNIVEPTAIVPTSGSVAGSPRVFVLGPYFVIIFTAHISSAYHLQYIGISSVTGSVVSNAADIVAAYDYASTVSWDGVVVNNQLFVSYTSVTGGQALHVAVIVPNQGGYPLEIASTASFSGSTNISTLMSMCVDNSIPTSPVIYINFYNSNTSVAYSTAIYQNLAQIFAPTSISTSTTILNLASYVRNLVCYVLAEVQNSYSYGSSIPSNYISSIGITQSGSPLTPITVVRSVGIASKAFLIDGVPYFLAAYESGYQKTYFLIGAESETPGLFIVAKLAYENGGGYLTLGLPSVTVNGSIAQMAYLVTDTLQALSTLNNTSQTTTGGVFTQTGINLVSFTFGTSLIDTAEIGNNLNIGGGFLSAYDGYQQTEQNFFLWPDSIQVSPDNVGGGLSSQEYFYQVCYEWTDNQGNLQRSAPSIPSSTNLISGTHTFTSTFSNNVSSITVSSATDLVVGQVITDTTTGSNIAAGTYITSISGTTIGLSQPTVSASAGGGDTLYVMTGMNTVYGPYLRLTYKTNVRIVIYRWSAAQQVYYQVTSITQPLLNSLTSDSWSYVDTQPDAAILGNNILYTTGGVIEDVNAPATNLMTLFDTRLWLVDSEDQNLLWFSKQVIEDTPVEMSDLLTFYIAPTTGAQGSTGVITALSVMDDKLIIFKKDAIYFINGVGPDNTGSNNQYNGPIFITSTVGCAIQQSVVFTPNGLMFQSDKGIWILGRDLSVSYIGAPVEEYTLAGQVVSAIGIPGTNQVRFTMNSGITLMYDYYVGQWGTFVGIPGISSTLFQGLHTFINSYGDVLQETPGEYLDGSNPVLLSLETSEFNLSQLQGYQRLFFFFILGSYITPFKLNVQVAYDYAPYPEGSVIIQPNNFTPNYGGDTVYGQSTPYGGHGSLLRQRVFVKRMRCQSFRVYISEVYDPSFGVPAGAGFTLSGLNCIIGFSKPFRPSSAQTSAGIQ